MRIGIDCTAAVRQGAGIGRYTRGLVRALTSLNAHEYVLLVGGAGVAPETVNEALGAPQRARTVHLPLSDRTMALLWHRLWLPLPVECVTGPVDVFHSPDFTLPPTRTPATVLTVHDLSFLRVPESSDPRLRAYLERVVPRSVRRARVILADSIATRNDLVDLLGTEPERIEVVYPGLEPQFARVTDPTAIAAVRARYDLPARFVLAVGTLQPRKNLVRLIEALALLPKGCDVHLVIAGGPGWMYERIIELASASAGRVRLLGYVRDADLPALYSLAEALAFPSLYEGFGLPVLEAMACETPVLTSNVSSLPEVAGDAALLVNPLDTSEIAHALTLLLDDTERREELVRRGRERSSQFTWVAAAAQLQGIYERIGLGSLGC